MLTYFLFFFYLVSGTILLHIIIRRKIFPFKIYHTTAIVFFKVIMGCVYGWVFLHFYHGDDTWNYFIESKDDTNLLMQHPLRFFHPFSADYPLEIKGLRGWDALVFYVNDFERLFIIKGLAVLNLLSGKSYYTDVVLFEFLMIGGPLLLFKLLAREFPNRIGMNFLLIFFVPSVIFWCSGIRAEGLLLFFMILMIYNGQAYARKAGIGPALGCLAGLLGLLLIRYQFLVIFLPPFIAYWISVKKQLTSPRYFNRIYLICLLIFAISLFLPPARQLSRPIRKAQESFFVLKGNTEYKLDSLKPGPISFVRILPQATVNTFFRPYPWEGKSLLQSLSSVDVIFIVAGLFFFIVSPRRRQQISHPLYWLFLYYSISQLIIIGYVVPFPGAIVRYRSISFLLLVLFLYAGNPLLQQKLRYWIFKLH
jgi:hypothetical protein